MQLRYNYRVDPQPRHQIAFAKAFGCVRAVFNDGLAARQQAHAAGLPYITDAELSARLGGRAEVRLATELFGEIGPRLRDRLMVSHDTVNCWQGGYNGGDPAELQKALPNWRMPHLFENIFPELKRMGMSQEDLDHIVIENPRRYFDEAAKAG